MRIKTNVMDENDFREINIKKIVLIKISSGIKNENYSNKNFIDRLG